MMARERERVFALQRFSIQEQDEINGANNADQQKDNQNLNIFSHIYGNNYGGANNAADKKTTIMDDSDDAEYVEPARTSYPEDQGILNNFAARNKPSRVPDGDDDMEFN